MKNSTRKIMSVALAGAIIGSVKACANAESLSEDYMLYNVEEGDTLGNIAYTYYGNSDYYEDIAIYNGIENPNELYVDQTLKLPVSIGYDYCRNVVVVQEPVVSYEEDQIYTVQNGDTMTCIANKFYGKDSRSVVDRLATYNELEDPNRIVLGQELLIPCFEKLETITPNDYTCQYNRMDYILYHQNDPVCVFPHFKFNDCDKPFFDFECGPHHEHHHGPHHDKCLKKTLN